MSDSLTIRQVVPADFAQWQILWHGYNRFYGRDSVAVEITETTWARFFDAHEPMHALVAERDGKLLGLVHYLFHRSTSQIELTCYLQDLFTNEAARGQGVGHALIEAVYEQAKIAGSPRVYWLTQENNVTARKLYDKVATYSGFIVYSKK
jgi:GNAT superfamily N-acetyltransferase